MRRISRIGTAAIVASVMAIGLTLGAARVEAKGKKGGGDAQEAICTYLAAIINYDYVHPTIKALTLSLFEKYGCATSLLE